MSSSIDNNEVTLVFEQDSDYLNPVDLGDFMFLFKTVYHLAKTKFEEIPLESIDPSKDEFFKVFSEYLEDIGLKELDGYLEQHEVDLRITGICKNSPLEIIMLGGVSAIFLSIIFCGGEIDVLGLKAKMKPLGEGIESLRKALSLDCREATSYSVTIKPIKLSKDEYVTLMEPIRGQGGFQNLLRELQNRIDKTRRKLDLYPADIDRIKRYGSNKVRGKGGFQGRVNRIFGNHMDLS